MATVEITKYIANKPKRTVCGAPDHIATRNDIPVGYNIGTALFGKANKEQFDRYKQTLGNINSAQYFDKVPQETLNFYIGGYQPAQKWLKDRKGQKLEYEDIEHYRKIVLVLRETGRVMGEIGEVGLSGLGG